MGHHESCAKHCPEHVWSLDHCTETNPHTIAAPHFYLPFLPPVLLRPPMSTLPEGHGKDTHTDRHGHTHTYFLQIQASTKALQYTQSGECSCPHAHKRTSPPRAQALAHKLCASVRSVLLVCWSWAAAAAPLCSPAATLGTEASPVTNAPRTAGHTQTHTACSLPTMLPLAHLCATPTGTQLLSASPSALSAPALKTMTVRVTPSMGSFLFSHPFASLVKTDRPSLRRP